MARKRTETATEPSKEIKAKGKFTRAKKCMKTTTTKKLFHESGSRKEEKSLSKCSDESPSSQVQKPINTKDGAQEVVPVLDLHSVKEVRLSGKMKLQLFPLDSHTREGLEKDGFHPYLELTLSSRKKLSSVLQHINSKWGSSEIARGDPTLYPYDKSVLVSGHKWKANSNTTAGDIYEAFGAPSLFRLRYGWSSEADNKTSEPPSPSTPGIACLPMEEPQNIISDKVESAGFQGKKMFGLDNPFTMVSSSNQVTDPPPSENIPLDGQVKSTENKIKDGSGPTFFSWDDGLTSLSIGGLLSEVSLKGNFRNQNSNAGNASATLWDENLTNISIGGLLSEASLQGRRGTNREQESTHNKNNDQPRLSFGGLFSEASSLGEGRRGTKREQESTRNKNNDEPRLSFGGLFSEASSLGEGRFSDCNKTWEMRRAITQQPLISDSLDAFLVNQTDKPQASCSAPPPPELSHSSILDAEDTCHAFSFRKRTTTSQKVLQQVSEEAEEDQQKDESKRAKRLFGSTVFNQDSSLGFSGIKWADSRGPFDFGLSSSQKFTNGDSVSFGAALKDLQETKPIEEKTK